jgi:hypothetical protein
MHLAVDDHEDGATIITTTTIVLISTLHLLHLQINLHHTSREVGRNEAVEDSTTSAHVDS